MQTANGNAQTVFNYANAFLSDEEHNRRFSTYGKYLTFDCDDPPDIQAVILAATDYELLISNPLFEIWLLMHFEDVETKISKREIYHRLSGHLHTNYSKGHKGKTREIVRNGNIEKAIDSAKALERDIPLRKKYIHRHKSNEPIHKRPQTNRTIYGRNLLRHNIATDPP